MGLTSKAILSFLESYYSTFAFDCRLSISLKTQRCPKPEAWGMPFLTIINETVSINRIVALILPSGTIKQSYQYNVKEKPLLGTSLRGCFRHIPPGCGPGANPGPCWGDYVIPQARECIKCLGKSGDLCLDCFPYKWISRRKWII